MKFAGQFSGLVNVWAGGKSRDKGKDTKETDRVFLESFLNFNDRSITVSATTEGQPLINFHLKRVSIKDRCFKDDLTHNGILSALNQTKNLWANGPNSLKRRVIT